MSTETLDSFITTLKLDVNLDRQPSTKARLKITAKVSNTSHLPVVYCRYMIEHRLLSSITAEAVNDGTDFELLTFQPTEVPPISAGDFVKLEAEQFFEIPIDLEHWTHWHWIRRHSRPPILTRDHAASKLPSNHYRFNFAISSRLVQYRGQPGCHDHTVKVLDLPREAPGFTGNDHSCIQGYLATNPTLEIQ